MITKSKIWTVDKAVDILGINMYKLCFFYPLAWIKLIPRYGHFYEGMGISTENLMYPQYPQALLRLLNPYLIDNKLNKCKLHRSTKTGKIRKQ